MYPFDVGRCHCSSIQRIHRAHRDNNFTFSPQFESTRKKKKIHELRWIGEHWKRRREKMKTKHAELLHFKLSSAPSRRVRSLQFYRLDKLMEFEELRSVCYSSCDSLAKVRSDNINAVSKKCDEYQLITCTKNDEIPTKCTNQSNQSAILLDNAIHLCSLLSIYVCVSTRVAGIGFSLVWISFHKSPETSRLETHVHLFFFVFLLFFFICQLPTAVEKAFSLPPPPTAMTANILFYDNV